MYSISAARLIVITLALTSLVSGSVKAGIDSWTSNGPFGASVSALAIDPNTPSILYVSTWNGGAFKSTDSGGSWNAINNGLTNLVIRAMAIDPLTPTTLYAGTDGGVFKSTDSGDNWSAINNGLTGTVVLDLAIDPTTPSTLYAGTNGGAFKSTDNGGNWSVINNGLTISYVVALVIDPITSSTLYASTSNERGVFKSTDSGSSWSEINNGLTNLNIRVLVIDPITPNTLYAGTIGGGAFKSTDSGGSWSAINNGLTDTVVLTMVVDPITPSILYAGTADGGAFKSTDSGGSWNAISNGLTDTQVEELAIDPITPTSLYAGTAYGGVFKSTDNGDNWSDINIGLIQQIRTLAINPIAPSTLYAGTNDLGAYKSTISGASWSIINDGLAPFFFVKTMAIDPITPNILYAGTIGGGAFKSTDSGGSWSAINNGLTDTDVVALTIDPITSSTLYAGTDSGVFKSTDSGSNWGAINNGLTNTIVLSLAIDPVTPSTLYAGAYDGVSGGAFTSTDSGSNWSAISNGLTSTLTYVLSLAIDPTTPSTLYAGTFDDGVFMSTNGGGSWNAINNGLTDLVVRALAIDPITPSSLYAGTDGGVFKSTDSGDNWTAINNGLIDLNVWALAIDPITPNILHAGTKSGVFHLTQGLNADNRLEIVFLKYSDGSDGALYGITMEANKDGATTFEISTPGGTFGGSKTGDIFRPDQLFYDSLTDITFAKLATEIASDWTLIWDKGLVTETVAIIRFRTFGTLMESNFLTTPILISPLSGATDISPNTSIDWTYDVPVADAQRDAVEVFLFGPTDPGLVSGTVSDLIDAVLSGPSNLIQSSDELPLDVTSWSPAAPLNSGTWVVLPANSSSILSTADGLGGPITGDPWVFENQDWLELTSIAGAGFTVTPNLTLDVPLSCPGEPTDMVISYGDSVICSLETQGDIDIVRFNGVPGEQVIIRATRTSGSGGEACLDLYDPSTTKIASACGVSPLTFSVTIETQLGDEGLYTALFQAKSASSTFDYTLVLERIYPISPTSEPVFKGEILSRKFDFAGDVDLYHFPGAPDDNLIIKLTRTNESGGNPCVDFFSPSGQPLQSACGEIPTSSTVTIEPILSERGNYIIQTSSKNPGQTFEYNLMLLCIFGDCPGFRIFGDGFE